MAFISSIANEIWLTDMNESFLLLEVEKQKLVKMYQTLFLLNWTNAKLELLALVTQFEIFFLSIIIRKRQRVFSNVREFGASVAILGRAELVRPIRPERREQRSES